MKRRSLVVTDAAAGHPFLASLPPHVRGSGDASADAGRRWPIDPTSVREFLMAYCACFLAISLFIA